MNDTCFCKVDGLLVEALIRLLGHELTADQKTRLSALIAELDTFIT